LIGLTNIALRAMKAVLVLRLEPFDISEPDGRSMERHRRIALSTAAAAVNKAVAVGAALISVPLTLHYLGAERYGMWMAMSSLIAVLSFTDFGIGNGLLNAVAQANGRDDRGAIRGLVSSAFFILSAVALTLGLVALVANSVVPWPRLFNVQSALAAREVGPAFAVLFACFALAIPFGIVEKVQMGLQQAFAASLWQCGASVLSLAGLLLVIHFQGGLPWLVLTLVAGPLVGSALNTVIYFGATARDIAPSARLVSRRHMIQIARIGLLFLFLQIVVAVAFSSDNIVIAQILGASAVAEYAVPERMFSIVSMVFGLALVPLWPAYGEAIERGDRVWVRRTLQRSLLLAFGFAGFGSMTLVLIGPQLLALWVGHVIDPPFLLLLGLGLWKVIETCGKALGVFLNGATVIRLQLISGTLMAVAAITLKIVFVKRFGIVGVPWATITAYLIFSAVPFVFFVPRLIREQAIGGRMPVENV
jgi:O-antigen/teichoic acid export membrane protein